MHGTTAKNLVNLLQFENFVSFVHPIVLSHNRSIASPKASSPQNEILMFPM